MLDTVVISGDDVCCSVVFDPLVGFEITERRDMGLYDMPMFISV